MKESVFIVENREQTLTTLSPIQREALRYGLMACLVAEDVTIVKKEEFLWNILPEDSTIYSLKESLFPGWMNYGTFCQECGNPYRKVREWHMFCSSLCRVNNWNRMNRSTIEDSYI